MKEPLIKNFITLYSISPEVQVALFLTNYFLTIENGLKTETASNKFLKFFKKFKFISKVINETFANLKNNNL